MFPINVAIAEALRVKRKRKASEAVARGVSGSGLGSQPLEVEPALLQQLKAAVRGGGGGGGDGGGEQSGEQRECLLQELNRQLVLELGSPSGATRVKALQLLDVLFRRVPAFRALACRHLRAIVSCAGVGPQLAGLGPSAGAQHAPPKDHQQEVSAAALRMIEVWDNTHGDDFPALRALARYLRESSGVQMPNVEGELRAQEESRLQARCLLRWRLLYAMNLLPSGLPQPPSDPNSAGDVQESLVSELREAKDNIQQLQECFRVLFPGVNDSKSFSNSNKSMQSQQVLVVDSDSDEGDVEDDDDVESTERLCDFDDDKVNERTLCQDDSDVEWEDNCSDEGDVVAEEENRDEIENNSSIPTKVTEKERIAGHRRISEVDSETAEELLRVARSAMPFAMNIDLARGSVSSSHGGDAGSGGLVVFIAIKELYQQLRAVDFPRLKKWNLLFQNYELEELISQLAVDNSDAACSTRLVSSCSQARRSFMQLQDLAEDLMHRCKVYMKDFDNVDDELGS